MSRSKLRQTCVIIIVTPKYTKVKFNFNYRVTHVAGASKLRGEERWDYAATARGVPPKPQGPKKRDL